MPKVSIIIPVYNHALEISETLHSLKLQSFSDFEIIVIDDGSTDDLKTVINEEQKKYPFTFIDLKNNQGAPVARNKGAELAKGEYLLFLDADATLRPEALQQMVQALGQHPEVDFVYSSFIFGMKKFLGREFDPDALRRGNYIHTSSLLRASAFPGFDESLKKFQDWDLWLAMVAKGSRGYWLPDYLLSFRQLPASKRAANMSFWLPKIVYRFPWPLFGWMPKSIRRYREAEKIIKDKHHL